MRNIVAAPPIVTGRPRIGMVVRRAASPWPTARLPQGRDKPAVKPLPGRGKPAGRQRLALVEAVPEARELPLPVMLPPAGQPAEPRPASGLLPPVTPPPAALAAAEARVPLEEVPGDTTDPALAPPGVAVPPVWDLEAAEASVVVVAGADEAAV